MLSWAKKSAPAQDQDTLASLKARDHCSQEALLRAERQRLLGIARSILPQDADAEGLVADVFSDFLYLYVDRLREARAIQSYLTIMTVRRARRERDHIVAQLDLDTQTISDDPSSSIQSQLDDQQRLSALKSCLEQLPLRSRDILKLHYGHDRSYATISSDLGVTKQAVGKTVKKCLEALRLCLEKRLAITPKGGEAWA